MKKLNYLSLLLGLLILIPVTAQDEPPRLSPKASVSQVVGYTKVTITYSRPGVKDRQIWDGLVPYNEVWRTGANEATVIEFEDDLTLAGNQIPEGRYGLFTIPGEDEWTIIINKVWDQWGAFNYNVDDDLLRFKVKPRKSDYTERLLFTFEYASPYSAHIIIEWNELEVPLLIETK